MFNNIEATLREALTVVHCFVLVGGIIICILNRHLSRWMWLLVLGLVGFLAEGVVHRVFVMLLNRQIIAHEQIGLHGWFTTVIDFVAWLFIVGGLWSVFRDVTERMKILYFQAHPSAPSSQPLGT